MNAIEQYIEMANETLQEASLMIEHQHYRAAVSRAYYASFYAVQAALESVQITAKTHQGALAMFNKHFIKTGLLSKEYSKFLQDNLDQRLVGDYEIGFKAQFEDADEAIYAAKKILNGIKDYLNM